MGRIPASTRDYSAAYILLGLYSVSQLLYVLGISRLDLMEQAAALTDVS